MRLHKSTRPGFSLVELIVVIVIIGLLAAMAIPKMSRGTAGAAATSLAGDLAIIRGAINMYEQEHTGGLPGPLATNVVDQLTTYSSDAGATQATKDATYKYGPYLLRVPPCPVVTGANNTDIAIDTTNSPPVVTGGNEGWVYNPNTGEIIANSSATDEEGKAYSAY